MDVEREVREFVVKNFLYGDDNTGLKETDSFIDRGIIDSTGVLEIVNFLESRFEIALRDDELVPDNMNSLEKITHYISKKTGKSQPV